MPTDNSNESGGSVRGGDGSNLEDLLLARSSVVVVRCTAGRAERGRSGLRFVLCLDRFFLDWNPTPDALLSSLSSLGGSKKNAVSSPDDCRTTSEEEIPSSSNKWRGGGIRGGLGVCCRRVLSPIAIACSLNCSWCGAVALGVVVVSKKKC